MLVRVKLPLIAAISLLTVFVDQATKSLAAQHLIRGEVHSYLFDTVRIVYAENIGAFLGLGGHLSSGARFWVFVVLVGLFLLGLVAYALFSRELNRPSVVALALLFAGGLSNFYDRLVNNGAVIDFLNVGVGALRTGVFNVADMAIMLGLFLLIFYRPRPTLRSEEHTSELQSRGHLVCRLPPRSTLFPYSTLFRSSVVALALLFAGGLSNFYDRLVNNGAVIDFLNVGVGALRTGVFNVADMAIMLGLFLLIFYRPRPTLPD